MTEADQQRVAGDRRARTRGELQREAILDAVRDLVAEMSIFDVTIGAITKRSGITRSVFYFYFDTKYAALAVALAEATAELDQATTTLPPRAAGESAPDYLLRLLLAGIVVNARHQPVVSAAMAARNSDQQLREMTARTLDTYTNGLAEFLDTQAQPGFRNTARTRATLRILCGMTILAGQHPDLLGEPDQFEQSLQAIVHIWHRSLWTSEPDPLTAAIAE
jgi:AcrR family transcriptional regulator